MDKRTVNKLEDKLTLAVMEVVLSMGLKRLPLLPSHHTMHLMAKAATAVYETAVENMSDAGKKCGGEISP